MDIVKLRKLTEKSIWDYGKYQGHTVKSIMIINRKYILWAYYNLEKISFVDEILDELASHYINFKRIDKPGKEPEYYDEFSHNGYQDMTKNQLFKLISAKRINGQMITSGLLNAYRVAKSKYIHANRNETLSRESLQEFNHGKGFEEDLSVRVYKKK